MKTKRLLMISAVLAIMVIAIPCNSNALTINANDYFDPNFPTGADYVGPIEYSWGMAGNESSNAVIVGFAAAYLADLEVDYTELYKLQTTEEGTLAGSYSGSFDDHSATITYDGGLFISPAPVYVLVKDGSAEPNWYLIRTTWNGTDTLYFQNFFLGNETHDQGGISHISLFGSGYDDTIGQTPVPEPSTLILLGLGLLGMASVRKLRK